MIYARGVVFAAGFAVKLRGDDYALSKMFISISGEGMGPYGGRDKSDQPVQGAPTAGSLPHERRRSSSQDFPRGRKKSLKGPRTSNLNRGSP